MEKIASFNHGGRVAVISWYHDPPREDQWEEKMNANGEVPCEARINQIILYKQEYEPAATKISQREINCITDTIDEIKSNEPYWVPYENLV